MFSVIDDDTKVLTLNQMTKFFEWESEL